MDVVQTAAQSTGTAPNGEDLDVVLGRFQSWAKTQRNKLGKTALSSKLPLECREISYEQAMQASSRRRPVNPVVLPDPIKSVDPAHAKDFASLNAMPATTQGVKIPATDPSVAAGGDASSAIGSSAESHRAGRRFAQAAQTISDALGRKPAIEDVPDAVNSGVVEAFPLPPPEQSGLQTSTSIDADSHPALHRTEGGKAAQPYPEAMDVGAAVNFHAVLERALISGDIRKQILEASHDRPGVQPQAAPRPNREAIDGTAKIPFDLGQDILNRQRSSTNIVGSPSQTSLAESFYPPECEPAGHEPEDRVAIGLARLYRQHSSGDLPVPRSLPSITKFGRSLTAYLMRRSYRPEINAPRLLMSERADHPHSLSEQITSR